LVGLSGARETNIHYFKPERKEREIEKIEEDKKMEAILYVSNDQLQERLGSSRGSIAGQDNFLLAR